MTARPVVARAPAKVNLSLHVGPLRTDGFHEIATVYHAVDLYDEVTAEPRSEGAVSVETRDPAGAAVSGLADDHRNLAARAASALRARTGAEAGVHLRIRKQIPVAGGLAGGSADAAAALIACNRLWGLDAGSSLLAEVATGLGSDVPFALVGGTAVGAGRGELLRSVRGTRRMTWVAVLAASGLSTAAVYAETDRLRSHPHRPDPTVDAALVGALERGDLAATARLLHNELQPAAVRLRPELAATLDAGRDAGALAGLVSGSGPTVLLLVTDDAHAREVAAAVQGPTVTVHGPAPGAALVDG